MDHLFKVLDRAIQEKDTRIFCLEMEVERLKAELSRAKKDTDKRIETDLDFADLPGLSIGGIAV